MLTEGILCLFPSMMGKAEKSIHPKHFRPSSDRLSSHRPPGVKTRHDWQAVRSPDSEHAS